MEPTIDPESMTSEEREQEVVGILARGLLRRVRLARMGRSAAHQKASEKSQKGLAPGAETRLSVAPRPGG